MTSFMNNRQLARMIRTLATFHDVQNPKETTSRRYRQAAEIIRSERQDLVDQPYDTWSTMTLGIDADILQVIRCLLEEGFESALRAAQITLPLSLRELFDLPGLRTQYAKALFQEAGILSLDALEKALDHGHTLPIPRSLYGELADEIKAYRVRKRQLPLWWIEPFAQDLTIQLTESLGKEVKVTGDLARREPTMEELELLLFVNDEQEASHFHDTLISLGFHKALDHAQNDDLAWIHAVYFRSETIHERTVAQRLYMIKQEHQAFAQVMTSANPTHRALLQQAPSPMLFKATTENEVYRYAKFPFYPVHLRDTATMPVPMEQLVTKEAYVGDLHMHTQYSDGRHTLEQMVQACVARGYQYMTISDHSQSLTIARGLTYDRLMRQKEEILRLRELYPMITILHGSEVDILPDARLDFDDAILSELDIVVASIHTALRQSKEELTARALYAINSPYVSILAHPTSRMLGRRDSFPLDFEKVFEAAARTKVAIECNANPERLDLDYRLLREGRQYGCLFSIDSDAHATDNLTRIEQFGIPMAQKGWLEKERVINTWPLERLLTWLHRN